MNAKIILLVTLIGYVLAQSDVCTVSTPSCVSTSGGTCSATASPATFCDASAGLFCSGGSCAATLAANAACSLSGGASQCGYSTTQCIANSNYTDYACLGRYLNPGQTCTSDDQCYFGGNANGASNSTCVSGKCFGSVGSNCTVSFRTCPTGSSCVGAFGSAVCTATASDGACTTLGFADNTCPSGYCTSAGKCGNRFQGVSGSTCGSNDECGDGLFCALSGPNADKTCRAIFSSSNAACTIGGAACAANYESCGCNSARNTVCQAPRGNPTGYVAAATAYHTCVAANPQCSIDPWCSACQSQTCSYFKIRDGSNLGYNPSFTCQLSTAQRAQAALCKADSSSTSASSAVVASVLVASAAAFVVLA